MVFKETSQHVENRYTNARTVLSSLYELQHFNGNSDQPTEWELGRKQIAKLSDEEYEALKDIITTTCNVFYNIQVDTDYSAVKYESTLNRFFKDIDSLRK